MEIVEAIETAAELYEVGKTVYGAFAHQQAQPHNVMGKKRRASFASKRPKTKRVKTDLIQKGFQRGKTHPGAPKAELKAYDNSIASTDVAVGNLTCLNDQVQGTAYFNRVGQRCYMKSIRVRGNLTATASTPATQMRIIIFYDSQPNQPVAFSLATLLTDANAGLGADVFSHLNLQNRERFQILRDHFIALPSVTIAATLTTQIGAADYLREKLSYDEYIKLDGLESLYTQTNAGTLTDLTIGSLYIITIGGAVSNGNWTFTGRSRLRFYD